MEFIKIYPDSNQAEHAELMAWQMLQVLYSLEFFNPPANDIEREAVFLAVSACMELKMPLVREKNGQRYLLSFWEFPEGQLKPRLVSYEDGENYIRVN